MARIIVITVALTLMLSATAAATPIAKFAFMPLHPQVGTPVRFQGKLSVCDIPPCSYAWRAYQARADGTLFPRLGINFGRLPIAFYTFTTPGRWLVTLSVTNSGPGRAGPGSARESTLGKYVTVTRAVG